MNNSMLIKELVRTTFSSRLARPILSVSAALLCVFSSAAFEASHAAAATSLVANGNFDIPSGTGPTKLVSDANGATGPSAAKDWGAFNDNAATTTTELLPSPLVPGGKIIHVVTTNAYDGIYQQFASIGPTHVFTCDWIYIKHGAVGIGSGYGAATTIDATLFKTGSWEVLNVGNISQPAILTIIYSQYGPADFYVESVSVSQSHQQCNPS